MTYKEYYLKQYPESASIIDEIIKQRCPAEVVNCKYSITNQSDCFYQKAPPTADVEVICEACWNQKMEENIKEEKEKKNMTYKELWIALHPGEEFVHDNEWEGECPDDLGYEPKNWDCPKDEDGATHCKYCWDREVPEETIEKFLGKKTIKTPKFKVGDRVKVVNPINGCFGAENKIGVVTTASHENGLVKEEPFLTINIELEDDKKIWCVNADGCLLIEEKPVAKTTNTSSCTEKSPKFKVGDKVRVIHPVFGLLHIGGKVGIVTDEAAPNGLMPDSSTINIRIQDDDKFYHNKIYCINEDGCELITKAPAPEKTTDEFPRFNDWNGKIIKLESGMAYLVVPFDIGAYHNFALLSPEGNIELITENSIPDTINGERIIEVYKFVPLHTTLSEDLTDLCTSELLWKAKEKKKMTYEDIIAALGYEFELV